MKSVRKKKKEKEKIQGNVNMQACLLSFKVHFDMPVYTVNSVRKKKEEKENKKKNKEKSTLY